MSDTEPLNAPELKPMLVDSSVLLVGEEVFALGGLSPHAKEAIMLFANRSDLVARFAKECESVWITCEAIIGELSREDRQLLTKLYDLFIAPDRAIVIYPKDKPIEAPVNNWISDGTGPAPRFPWDW